MVERLRRLRGEGVKVGLSLTGPRQKDVLDKALAVGVFDAVQATFNVLETSVGPALQRAHDAGLVVIIKEGMANGGVPSSCRRCRARRGGWVWVPTRWRCRSSCSSRSPMWC